MGLPTEFDVLKANCIISPQLVETAGKVWFVGNGNYLGGMGAIGASNGNDGQSPLRPFSTLAYAITKTSKNRGDVIYVLPGHSEDLATGMTLGTASTQIIGLGVGDARPRFRGTAVIDVLSVTATGCVVKNLVFRADTAAVTAKVNLSGPSCKISGCTFYSSANTLNAITVTGTSDFSEIVGNEFIVTANGPDSAIVIEDAGCTGLKVLNNYFDGGSNANAWDNGAVYSTVAHTNCLVQANTFRFGVGVNFTSATSTGYIVWNYGGEVYNPGGCELLMAGGGTFVSSGGGAGFSPDAISTDGADTIHSESTTGKIYYVHFTDGLDTNSGVTPLKPFKTMSAAMLACESDKSDMIILMPGSHEVLSATNTQITIDKHGVKIIGLGSGVSGKASIEADATFAGTSYLYLDADGVEIAGVMFLPGAAGSSNLNFIEVEGVDYANIHDNVFKQGANEATAIAFLGAAVEASICSNQFYILANGPISSINSSLVTLTNLIVADNAFCGNTPANAWDGAAILSSQANANIKIYNNEFFALKSNTNAIDIANSTGAVYKNRAYGASTGFGYSVGTTPEFDNQVFDTLGCGTWQKCKALVGVVSVDNSGGTTPQTVATLTNPLDRQLEILSIWIDLKTAPHLQVGQLFIDHGDGIDMPIGLPYTPAGNQDGILIQGPIVVGDAAIIKYAANVAEAGALNIGYKVYYR